MKKEINLSNGMINRNQKVTASAILEKDMGTSTWDENSMPSVRIKWNGYAFNEIKLPNGKNIVIDPFYHNVDNKYILDKKRLLLILLMVVIMSYLHILTLIIAKTFHIY